MSLPSDRHDLLPTRRASITMGAESKMVVYTPALPPVLPADTERPAEKLLPKQETMLNALLEHFGSAEYKVPGESPSELTEIEKFWLVRIHQCKYHPLALIARVDTRMLAEVRHICAFSSGRFMELVSGSCAL